MNTLPNVWEDPDYITLANRLPVIVTEPGRYRTRSGMEVIVHEVGPNGPVNQTRYAVKGSLLLPRQKRTIREYNIWHVSGRYRAPGEHPRDIVERIE